MSLRPQDHQAVPLGSNVGRAANDYAEPSGVYIAEILRRFVQFIDVRDWRDERAKVFDALVSLSFGARRSVAIVPRQMILRRLTGNLGEEVISRAVGDLEKSLGMLSRHERIKKDAGAHRDQRTGGMLYEIDPDPARWRVRWRLDAGERKLAIDEWAWVYSVNLNPQAPSLPLPSDVPGLADALRELAREAVLAHPLSKDFPPQSSSSGRTFGGLQTPDNLQRLCRQPLIGNEPAGDVREADASLVGPPGDHSSGDTSVHTSGATTPTTSDTAALPAHLQPTAENIAAAAAEMRRQLGLPPRVQAPEQVSSPANSPVSKLAETGGCELAGQLTSLAHAGASDVSEHLHLEHPSSGKGKIYLSSPLHPDVPDGCGAQAAEAEGPDEARPGDYTGNLVADLIRAMGAAAYAEYRGAWESYVACDRRGVIETLADYKLARRDPTRRWEVRNAGAWMGRVFRAKSRKWRTRQR